MVNYSRVQFKWTETGGPTPAPRSRKFSVFLTLVFVSIFTLLMFSVTYRRELGTLRDYFDENGCSNSIILLDDGGRMGNQFFEYLQATVLVGGANRNFYVKRTLYDKFSSYFDGMENRTLESVAELKRLCGKQNYKEFSMSYQTQLPRNLQRHPYIILKPGWPGLIPPALWKTLLSRRKELLKEFQWKPELKTQVNEYVAELTKDYGNFSSLIAVHVRMQDYYKHLKGFHNNVTLPGRRYFNESMNYFRRKLGNPAFLVVSNDMKWCRDNIEGDDLIFAGNGNESDPGWDMALLTSCDHLIMTYGSYGVMAAYLLPGTVIDNYTAAATH